jgi:hypothetical protein
MTIDPKDLAMKLLWLAALGAVVLVGSKVVGNVAKRADT